VCAGVLKDFFRQLPEPLFTNGLYQMLLDAMSVQIADDPHGNAVIMLGVIDCLPSIHQVANIQSHCRRQLHFNPYKRSFVGLLR